MESFERERVLQAEIKAKEEALALISQQLQKEKLSITKITEEKEALKSKQEEMQEAVERHNKDKVSLDEDLKAKEEVISSLQKKL